jgi:hypothetical protein
MSTTDPFLVTRSQRSANPRRAVLLESIELRHQIAVLEPAELGGRARTFCVRLLWDSVLALVAAMTHSLIIVSFEEPQRIICSRSLPICGGSHEDHSDTVEAARELPRGAKRPTPRETVVAGKTRKPFCRRQIGSNQSGVDAGERHAILGKDADWDCSPLSSRRRAGVG